MRSRYRILGLCLVAVLVACAAASATASAAAPEFFHCVKLTSKTGQYTSNTCETASKTKTGEFEKKAVPAGSKIKFTDNVGATRFYVYPTAYTVICSKGGTATGEVSGPTEVTNVYYVFTGCRARNHAGEECPLRSVGALLPEEIDTKALSGELGKVAAAEAPASETGLGLRGKHQEGAGDNWVELGESGTCFPRSRFEGGVIGEVGPTGVMDTAGELRFGVKGGEGKKWKQTIRRFVGGEESYLEWNGQGLQTGLESSNQLTFEEPIEVT